jgi:hypothetical protein
LQDPTSGRREIELLVSALAERLRDNLDLLLSRHLAIENEQILFAQTARTTSRPITNLAQKLLASYFDAQAAGRFG